MLARSGAVLRKGGRLVSIAEEPPATVAESVKATYFVGAPGREQLVELARLVDNETLTPRIDSVFPLDQARAAFQRVAMPGKRGKGVLQPIQD